MTPQEVCEALHEFDIKASPDKSRIRISITEARKLITYLRQLREEAVMGPWATGQDKGISEPKISPPISPPFYTDADRSYDLHAMRADYGTE